MREIVLFGAGNQAEKFVFEYGKLYDIKYVLDFSGGGEKFLGKYEKYVPTFENCRKYFVVCAEDYYMSKIRSFLTSIGREEINDYIWYEWDRKKMVVLNANCYGPKIKKYLMSNADFCENYYFYPVPPVHQNKQRTIDNYILKNCDVFIHQDIRADNNLGYKLSDDYLLSKLSENVKTITIPNLVGYGKIFFGQLKSTNEYNRPWPKSAYGLFPYGDMILDSLCKEKLSLNYILEKYKKTKFFSKFELEKNFNIYYQKYKEREEKWDVKILDYIMSFYREKKVFYDINHPANFIIRKISEDILKLLGINARLNLTDACLDSFEYSVYPNVRDILGLDWGGEEEIIREKSPYKLKPGNMNMEEYIQEYVYWCHQEQYWE